MALSLLAEPTRLRTADQTTIETELEPQLEPSMLPRRLGVAADLGCLMCGRTVGAVIKGKAYHHGGCTQRLRVQGGLLRCCQCQGPVYKEPVAPLTRR